MIIVSHLLVSPVRTRISFLSMLSLHYTPVVCVCVCILWCNHGSLSSPYKVGSCHLLSNRLNTHCPLSLCVCVCMCVRGEEAIDSSVCRASATLSNEWRHYNWKQNGRFCPFSPHLGPQMHPPPPPPPPHTHMHYHFFCQFEPWSLTFNKETTSGS